MASLHSLGAEVVVVASPTGWHELHAKQAIECGMAVICEKPLGTDLASTQRTIWRAIEHHCLVTVFQNRRFDGDFLTLQDVLATGTLGKVFLFESSMEHFQSRSASGPDWRSTQPASLGGGSNLDVISHLVDQATILWGAASTVYADFATILPGGKAEDQVFLSLSHQTGVISRLSASRSQAFPSPRFRVTGTDGTFVSWSQDWPPGRVDDRGAIDTDRPPGSPSSIANAYIFHGDGSRPCSLGIRESCWNKFYDNLSDALTEGHSPPVTPFEIWRSMVVLDAAQVSARTGDVVHTQLPAHDRLPLG
jgi:predicted dehydrogenase